MILVMVMFWPAIWAGTLMTAALAGDVIRQTRKPTSPAWPTLARGRATRDVVR